MPDSANNDYVIIYLVHGGHMLEEAGEHWGHLCRHTGQCSMVQGI